MSSARISHLRGVWRLYIPLIPVPGSPARAGKWGSYYLKRYAGWRSNADAVLKELAPPVPPTPDPVFCGVYTVAKRTRAGDQLPLPRGDVDNFAKAVLDAITRSGLIWEDDHQVQACVTGKRFAEIGEDPHTFVMVAHRFSHIPISTLFTNNHEVALPEDWDDDEEGEDVYDLPPADRVPLDDVDPEVIRTAFS